MIYKFMISLALLLACTCANAQIENSTCKRIAGSLGDLNLSNCVIQDGVLVAKYQKAAPASPFSTEFDKRNFFLALSSDSSVLYKRIGVRSKNRKISLISTLLAMPPEQDQILIRHVIKKEVKFGGWTVFFEEVQYAAQGQVPGYAMKCGTAIRSLALKNEMIAASECFPYRNKELFLETLNNIELP